MKVEAPSSSTIAAHRRANGIVAPGFSIPSQEVGAPQMTRQAQTTSAMVNVGSLLALQGIPESKEEKRKRATRRANDLLDQLEGLKVATLSGNINPQQMINLKNTLANGFDEIDDPNLHNILEAIEQRAEVELAKLERYL
jgi:Class II flagellar assembly regulator